MTKEVFELVSMEGIMTKKVFESINYGDHQYLMWVNEEDKIVVCWSDNGNRYRSFDRTNSDDTNAQMVLDAIHELAKEIEEEVDYGKRIVPVADKVRRHLSATQTI